MRPAPLRLIPALAWLLVTVASPCAAGAKVRPGQREAIAIADRAMDAYEREDFATAEALYRVAAQTDPAEVLYWYAAGKSAARGGRCKEAAALFAELRRHADATVELVGKADTALAECRPTPPVAPQPSAEPPHLPVAATPAEPAQATTETTAGTPLPLRETQPIVRSADLQRVRAPWTLWAGTGLAVAAVGLGGWAGWATYDLDHQLGSTSGAAARSQQATINGVSTAAVVVGTVAVTGLIHGLWYWFRPAKR